MPASLDIIIPTYNRAAYLRKNLELLDQQYRALEGAPPVRIIVSDNASPDNTLEALEQARLFLAMHLTVLQSERNEGPERNVVKVVAASNADYVMYLGDDDYLPEGYLQYVVNALIQKTPGCIIPGCSNLYPDGSLVPFRGGKAEEWPAGFRAILRLSHYGHQLSGLVFKRAEVLPLYLADDRLRNLYPYIFFLGYNLMRSGGLFVPQYKVSITQNNTKHWTYDSNGLAAHVFRNYEILFGSPSLRGIVCCLRFIWLQSWRLNSGPVKKFVHAWVSFLGDSTLSRSVRIAVLLFCPVIVAKGFLGSAVRRLKGAKAGAM